MDNNHFRISKRNRRGILALSIISLSIIFAPRILMTFREPNKFELISVPVNDLKIEFKNAERKFVKKEYSNKRFNKPKSKFDPNKYSISDWQKLGLSPKQAKVVVNFTRHGIYSNDDLRKIFVISDELFSLIKDSTFYPAQEFNLKSEKSFEQPTSRIKNKIELNSASEEDLLKINGIGPFFAKQIIRKREELGGFAEVGQLLEVWKMDQEKFDLIKNEVEINETLIKKISLNNANLDELKNHPYIRWNIANSIIKLRNQKNGFKSIEEIKESHIISEEKFLKIKSYISL